MIRLYFENQILGYNALNDRIYFIRLQEHHETADELRINAFDTYISSKPILKSYEAFIKVIRNSTSEKMAGEYLIIYNDKKFYVFKSIQYRRSLNFVAVYEPENDYMREYLRKLLRMDDYKNSTILDSSYHNHFAFITTWQILQLLLAKAYIESKGEKPFESFKKPKKSGGMRTIYAPNEKIKLALRDLNSLLQQVYDNRNDEFQIAYKKKKNVKSGAKLHTEHKYVFNLDLHDFYPSCKRELVEKYTAFLYAFSFNRQFIVDEFFSVILINDGLFIGSPISGTLANVIISNAVKYMNNICNKMDITVSVYADDISFSSNKFIVKDFILDVFNQAFSKYGLSEYFTINEKKSVGFTGCKRKITGVAINNDNKITVPRHYFRMLRTMIDHLAKGENIDVMALRGKIAYASMIDDSGKIYNYLMKYQSIVKQYNLCSDEKLKDLQERAGL